MARPVILITGGRKPDDHEGQSERSYWAGCPAEYVDAVLVSGGAPLLLPYNADHESAQSAVEKCDGVLLSGGGDIDSNLYGCERHEATHGILQQRDELELALIKAAIGLDLPILGICRGIQILNVALGGTLVQDIPSQVRPGLGHNIGGQSPDMHPITIEAGSLLFEVLGTGQIDVNSRHHQAVGDLGTGLRITAVAEDGVVEAIESIDGRPILAVQFHPENILESHPIFRRLFDWLVNEAAGRRMP